MQKVYVYSIESAAMKLEEVARQLGETIFWKANLSSFSMDEGLPLDWNDHGSVFSKTGELRWQKNGEEYRALLFLDNPMVEPTFSKIDGEWEAEEENIFLQDLNEPRIRPSFKKYPNGTAFGRLRAKICRRNGMIVCISPREILPREALNEF